MYTLQTSSTFHQEGWTLTTHPLPQDQGHGVVGVGGHTTVFLLGQNPYHVHL